jgi:hypothetical protein
MLLLLLLLLLHVTPLAATLNGFRLLSELAEMEPASALQLLVLQSRSALLLHAPFYKLQCSLSPSLPPQNIHARHWNGRSYGRCVALIKCAQRSTFNTASSSSHLACHQTLHRRQPALLHPRRARERHF